MNTFGDKLRLCRKAFGITQDRLADLVGTTKQVISRYEAGLRIPKLTVAQEYANALKIPVVDLVDPSIELKIWEYDDYLEDYWNANDKDRMFLVHTRGLDPRVASDYAEIMASEQERNGFPSNAIPYKPSEYAAPIIGRIPAGYPLLATDEIEGYAPIDYSDTENYFWLRVTGDSMVNADIHDGDLVLIRRQACAQDGQIVAARLNADEATLKRFRRTADTVMLVPENPKYSPIPVPASAFSTGDASIIGVVVELKRKFV